MRRVCYGFAECCNAIGSPHFIRYSVAQTARAFANKPLQTRILWRSRSIMDNITFKLNSAAISKSADCFVSTRALNTCNEIFFNTIRVISMQIRNSCRHIKTFFYALGSLNGEKIHLAPDHYFVSLISARKFLAQVGSNRNGRAEETEEGEDVNATGAIIT